MPLVKQNLLRFSCPSSCAALRKVSLSENSPQPAQKGSFKSRMYFREENVSVILLSPFHDLFKDLFGSDEFSSAYLVEWNDF